MRFYFSQLIEIFVWAQMYRCESNEFIGKGYNLQSNFTEPIRKNRTSILLFMFAKTLFCGRNQGC